MYYTALNNKSFPGIRGYNYSLADLKIVTLFQMVQSLKIDSSVYRGIFHSDVFEEFSYLWDILLTKKWIEINDGVINISGDGVFFAPIIQGLIALERNNEIIKSRK